MSFVARQECSVYSSCLRRMRRQIAIMPILMVKTIRGPRNGVQSMIVNLATTVYTFSKSAEPDALQSVANLSENIPLRGRFL